MIASLFLFAKSAIGQPASLTPFMISFDQDTIQLKNSALRKKLPLNRIPNIRVALLKKQKRVSFKSESLMAKTEKGSWAKLNSTKSIHLWCTRRQVMRNGKAKGKEYRVKAVNNDLKVNGKNVRGIVVVHPDPDRPGKCLVVNHLNLEWYLVGLLGMEMKSEWNLETLKAQAVASRTYALHRMKGIREAKKRVYDLESTEADQVYSGKRGEARRNVQAVRETAGVILSGKGKLIPAYYHSTCGGLTELPKDMWGDNPPGYSRVSCPYCHTSPAFRWTLALGVKDILKNLRKSGFKSALKVGKKMKPEEMVGLFVSKRSFSGRAQEVSFAWSGGVTSMKAKQFRNVMGTRKVKSEWFDLKRIPSEVGEFKVGFSGRGYGHGVGMCQWGAKRMGDFKKDFREILRFYYPKADLVKIYSNEFPG
jgi:stage II sporulation protein D